jgi:hypothetical protein
MFENTSEGGMTLPAKFTYTGHEVEIVPPDASHFIGNFWQIKIDGILQHNFLFSSARVATDQAGKFIDRQEQ